ncbi:MAG: hypothetical protein KAR39_02985 [Thermoplasmata archaeon]|nr:hypothetical protein [Thermoplasmata archaeon]
MSDYLYLLSAIIQATAVAYALTLAVYGYIRREYQRVVDAQLQDFEEKIDTEEGERILQNIEDANKWHKRFYRLLLISIALATFVIIFAMTVLLFSPTYEWVLWVFIFSIIAFVLLAGATASAFFGPLFSRLDWEEEGLLEYLKRRRIEHKEPKK